MASIPFPSRPTPLLLLLLLLSPSQLLALPQFQPPVHYAVGTRPHNLIAADIDGDGDLDLITANLGGNSVSLLWNDGTGAYCCRNDLSGFTGPAGVAASDVDGDGDQDLAVANHSGGFVSVLRNGGGGLFGNRVDYPTGADCHVVLLEDLDGDGDVDLVAVNRGTTNPTMSILPNDGNGVFCCKTDYPTADQSHRLLAADLDADGDKDLAVTNLGPSSGSNAFTGTSISIFSNNGEPSLSDSTFDARIDYPSGSGPATLVSFDCDNDGHLDLVAANSKSGTISVLNNNGDAAFTASTFSDRVDVPIRPMPSGVAAADFDGDGETELAVSWIGAWPVVTGDGVFLLKRRVPCAYTDTTNVQTGLGPYTVIAADLNGDSRIDLATGNWQANSVSVLLNTSSTISVREPVTGDPGGGIRLEQSSPNPASPGTTIRYTLAQGARASIRVWDIAGRLVVTLRDEWQEPGVHETRWDGTDGRGRMVPSGMYFYRLTAGSEIRMRRLLLIR